MKKALITILIFALGLSLAACGGKKERASKADNIKETDAAAESAITSEAAIEEKSGEEADAQEEKAAEELERQRVVMLNPGVEAGSWRREAFGNNAEMLEDGTLRLTASPYVFQYPEDYISGYVNPHVAGTYTYKTGEKAPEETSEAAVELQAEDLLTEAAVELAADKPEYISVEEHRVIVEASPAVSERSPEGNIIYLTFDDGPCKFTPDLLAILDEYNVKATFFVTNDHPESIKYIAAEAEKGHSIAVHSYCHNYAQIYNNNPDFFKDFMAMQEVIKAQTGSYSNIARFPGGSSNTISAKYAKGIMKELAAGFRDIGISYFDWNVASEDTSSKNGTEQIAQNIINGIKGKQYAVVLQHDIKPKSIEAVRTVIEWGLENGYVFMPLSSDSPVCHQHINN